MLAFILADVFSGLADFALNIMKLKKIKLSGFKSFVDPTTIDLQSNLTGVVGPNGCGKSNIIDSVRWVMGEISAKQLRGESMSDVIFNGSSSRKAVGQAVAELVFDNSDAGLGGEYAKYNEVSIRREVNRDGFSDYFLNSAGCRRKDITNIFLGTGLGPNSYAVIEQGMISKFIDAKPDELRVFIEEAAGISKYKERRRETENRIKHTKENLSRLNDILEEITKQLRHLKSQASAAERYRKLKQEERLAKGELHVLHWREVNKKLQEQEVIIKNDEAKLENSVTELHVLSAKIANLREQHNGDIEKFNEVQANYYRVGGNIARLEQQIKHAKERREELTRDLAQINQVWQETTEHQTVDQKQIELLTTEKATLESGIVSMQENVAQAKQEAQTAAEEMQLWQKSWDDFNINSSKIVQLLEVEQTHIKHLELRIADEVQGLEKFNSELQSLDFANLNTEVERLDGLFTELKNNHDKLHDGVVAKQQQIIASREANNQLSRALDQTRNKLQTLFGRKSSLEALQQAALGKTDTVLIDWLKEHNLEQKLRLAQELQVASGWETAVETVLGVYLEAVCVDGMASVVPAIENLTRGNLTLFDQAFTSVVESRLNVATLASKVNSKLSLNNLLAGIYIAENLAEALAMQSGLNHHESIVTKDGMWLGAGWLRVAYDANNPKIGILQRERELQELHQNIIKEQYNCEKEEQELEQHRNVLTTLEGEYQNLQNELRALMSGYSDTQSQVTAKKTYLHHQEERALVLRQEIEMHESSVRDLREQLAVAFKSHEEATRKQAENENLRQTIILKREQKEQRLMLARKNAEESERAVTDSTLRLQLIQTQVDYLAQSLERANKRLEGLKEHQVSIEKSLAEAGAPLAGLEQELQSELEKRLVIEAELTLAKQKVTGIEQELRELDEKHTLQQETNEKIRVSLERARTEREGMQVRNATYIEQVTELELQLEVLNAAIPEQAVVSEWEEKIAHLASRIERLGLINLAAIEEFEKLQERKNYLDAQNQDLVTALSTLEDVIRKIDHDTKERFKEAYSSINQKFQELFPKVFNGGKACLEQTEDNLLETGVFIMAQPPGKRNSSIHLLSGGEKALTAISLIFSIFHLNPAPFCILDEVDAPLDDSNVFRFCNLVKEMAKTIQFIFITHNKLTMEIAGQLVGVTMQEPGVSRIVSVDIDQAVTLAGN